MECLLGNDQVAIRCLSISGIYPNLLTNGLSNRVQWVSKLAAHFFDVGDHLRLDIGESHAHGDTLSKLLYIKLRLMGFSVKLVEIQLFFDAVCCCR